VKSRFNGALLIIAGGIALAYNLGYLRLDLMHLLRIWWPLILIAVGIGFFFSSSR
jgi:dipeptide/tripeptide permease